MCLHKYLEKLEVSVCGVPSENLISLSVLIPSHDNISAIILIIISFTTKSTLEIVVRVEKRLGNAHSSKQYCDFKHPYTRTRFIIYNDIKSIYGLDSNR